MLETLFQRRLRDFIMSIAYSYWIDEGQSQLVRGAQNIAEIESRGSRAASDRAMDNRVNKNNRHLGIAKSTEGVIKLLFIFMILLCNAMVLVLLRILAV